MSKIYESFDDESSYRSGMGFGLDEGELTGVEDVKEPQTMMVLGVELPMAVAKALLEQQAKIVG